MFDSPPGSDFLIVSGNSRRQTLRTMDLLPPANPKADRPLKSSNTAPLPDLNAIKEVDVPVPQRQAVLFRPNPPAINALRKPAPQAPQLTIFYGGKVMVFDNFPVDKAKELVVMAGTSPTALQTPARIPDRSTCPPPQSAAPASTSGNNPVAITTTTATNVPPECPPRAAHLPIASDLPIARRVSLNRFLEKRKGRLVAVIMTHMLMISVEYFCCSFFVVIDDYPPLGSTPRRHTRWTDQDHPFWFRPPAYEPPVRRRTPPPRVFPGFDKAEESASKSGAFGKREKAVVVTVLLDGKREPTIDLSAFGKPDETFGLATPR